MPQCSFPIAAIHGQRSIPIRSSNLLQCGAAAPVQAERRILAAQTCPSAMPSISQTQRAKAVIGARRNITPATDGSSVPPTDSFE